LLYRVRLWRVSMRESDELPGMIAYAIVDVS